MEVIPHTTFGNLRVVVIDRKPWFLGKDLATTLAYKNTRAAILRHVREKHRCTYEALQDLLEGGHETRLPSEMQPHTVFVDEAGMYSLVMGSALGVAPQPQALPLFGGAVFGAFARSNKYPPTLYKWKSSHTQPSEIYAS